MTACVGAGYRITDTNVQAGTFRIEEANGSRWACIARTEHFFECLADRSRRPGTTATTLTAAVKDIDDGPIQVQYPHEPEPRVIYRDKIIYKTKIVEVAPKLKINEKAPIVRAPVVTKE
jgi:hypothetical protein